MTLAVLLPARDEAPRLGPLLETLAGVLPGATVYVVDGFSRDETALVAMAAGARVIHPEGTGYAHALRAGYRACRADGVERLVQLDGDGQHPPEQASLLLAALEDADLVVGSRAGTHTPAAWYRRGANGLLSTAVRWATGQALLDVTSGFQALGPRAIRAFADHLPVDVADANVRVLAIRLGLTIREVPVRMGPRRGGASMHDGVQGVRNLVWSLGAVVRESLASPPPVD